VAPISLLSAGVSAAGSVGDADGRSRDRSDADRTKFERS